MNDSTKILTVNSVDFGYELSGTGEVVTFSCGTNFDRRLYRDQVAHLSKHFRVLSYDLRGLGESGDYPDVRFRYEEDLWEIFKALNIKKSALIGLSLGGGISINMALNHPDSVSALVLMAPYFTGYPWPYMHPYLKEVAEAWKNGDTDKAIDLWIAMPWFERLKKNHPEKLDFFKEMIRTNGRRSFSTPFPPREDWGTPMNGRMKELRVPTLILIGEYDTPDNRAVAGILKKNIADSILKVIPGSGHVLPVENPKAVNGEISAFLRSAIST